MSLWSSLTLESHFHPLPDWSLPLKLVLVYSGLGDLKPGSNLPLTVAFCQSDQESSFLLVAQTFKNDLMTDTARAGHI